MHRILIVTENVKNAGPWQHELIRAGYPVACSGTQREMLVKSLAPRPPEVFILDGTSAKISPAQLRELLEQVCPDHQACLIWLVTEELISNLDPACGIDDFINLPASATELLARVRLHLWKTLKVTSDDLIIAGPLVIDQANYSVSADGHPLELTFKEYELLRFLASHRGRVFTREALLNQVWG